MCPLDLKRLAAVMARYIEWLTRHARFRDALLASVVFAPVVVGMIAWLNPWFVREYGAQLLDMQMGVSHEAFLRTYHAYGEAGRAHYRLWLLYDTALPSLGALVHNLWMAAMLVRLFPGQPRAVRWALLGSVPAAFDLLENVGFLLGTTAEPARWLTSATWVASMLKVIALQCSWLMILALAVALVARRTRSAISSR